MLMQKFFLFGERVSYSHQVVSMLATQEEFGLDQSQAQTSNGGHTRFWGFLLGDNLDQGQ